MKARGNILLTFGLPGSLESPVEVKLLEILVEDKARRKGWGEEEEYLDKSTTESVGD